METRSKTLIVLFVVVMIVSIVLTYKRAFIDKDFEIINLEEE